MKQKVVVIGHGYTSRLGVIRALGRVGYEVVVIVIVSNNKDDKMLNINKPIDCYSKYISQIYYCPHDGEALVALLLEKCTADNQQVVVIPDSDFSAATIDLNQDRLKEHFLFPHINHKQGAVVDWMDKIKQKKTAEHVGLNVAKGWQIIINNGEYTIPEELTYPCFPKPLATLMGGKGGLKRCNNENDLKAVLASLIKRNPNMHVLVEEYKLIETEHALMGFTDGENVVIPGIIKTTSLANGGHFGVAKQGKIMPVTGFEGLIEQFKQFVKRTGYCGVFDIDFYKSEGKYYFCEMNFRYGGSGYAYTAMGVNLPVMMVKALYNEDYSEMKTDILSEKIFINERMCLDDWRGRFITTKQFKGLLDSADISFVKDENDEQPFKAFKREFRRLFIKRMIQLFWHK